MQLNDVLDDLYKEEGEVYKGTERVNAVKVCAEIDDIPEGYKEVPFYFLSKPLQEDVMNQVGSVYRFNAPVDEYYGFDENTSGNEIATGGYVSSWQLRKDNFYNYAYLYNMVNKVLYEQIEHDIVESSKKKEVDDVLVQQKNGSYIVTQAISAQKGTVDRYIGINDWSSDTIVRGIVEDNAIVIDKKVSLVAKRIEELFDELKNNIEADTSDFTVGIFEWDRPEIDRQEIYDYIYNYEEEQRRDEEFEKLYGKKLQAGKIKIAMIVQLDSGKYQVQSEEGKNLGTYDIEEEAVERLRQIEMFKHMNEKELSKKAFPTDSLFVENVGKIGMGGMNRIPFDQVISGLIKPESVELFKEINGYFTFVEDVKDFELQDFSDKIDNLCIEDSTKLKAYFRPMFEEEGILLTYNNSYADSEKKKFSSGEIFIRIKLKQKGFTDVEISNMLFDYSPTEVLNLTKEELEMYKEGSVDTGLEVVKYTYIVNGVSDLTWEDVVDICKGCYTIDNIDKRLFYGTNGVLYSFADVAAIEGIEILGDGGNGFYFEEPFMRNAAYKGDRRKKTIDRKTSNKKAYLNIGDRVVYEFVYRDNRDVAIEGTVINLRYDSVGNESADVKWDGYIKGVLVHYDIPDNLLVKIASKASKSINKKSEYKKLATVLDEKDLITLGRADYGDAVGDVLCDILADEFIENVPLSVLILARRYLSNMFDKYDCLEEEYGVLLEELDDYINKYE